MAYSESRWSVPPGDGREDITTAEITLPEEMDSAWCAMFNEAYGDGSMRTVIDSDSCLQQIPVRNRRFSDEPKHYANLDLWRLSGTDQHIIEGRVAGVKLISQTHDKYYRTRYDPYLVLTDVDVLTLPYPITYHPEQRILVPLGELDDICLYPHAQGDV